MKECHLLSGGDIATSFLLRTPKARFLLKTHHASHALEMFLVEKLGLETIANTNVIKTPTIYFCDRFQNTAFLVMQYIDVKKPSKKDFERLGHGLAQLHKFSSDLFGFSIDNYIGSLPQSNFQHHDWATFYFKERLKPQIEMARNKKLLSSYEIPGEDHMGEVCSRLLQEVTPSLLHGDLWSGNFLISENGDPYLIDPSTYFGHHEVDLAMTKLFGGFGDAFYSAYHEHWPSLSGSVERNDLYQLYYLLVHLNLFGISYYSSVKRILDRYF